MKKKDVAKKMGVGFASPTQPKPYGKGKPNGKGALPIPKSKTGKNEGNKLYEGKNEQERM